MTSQNSTCVMSGGAISGNKTTYCGGGVYIDKSAEFKISGGEITGNTAEYAKSGVFVYPSLTDAGKYTKTGGTVQSD